MTRPSDPLFDQRIADWLEHDPDHAPAQALEVVLAAVPSIRQRRAWRATWRFQTMPMFTRVAAAAVIGVIALGGMLLVIRPGQTVVGGPGPTPGASSSQPAASQPAVVVPSPTPSVSPLPSNAASPTAGCVNPPPDIAALSAQTDPVACYGNAPLTVDAHPIAAQIDYVVSVEPAWLGNPSVYLMLVGETRKVGAPFLIVAVDPAIGASMPELIGTNVRITGHYDDPAAKTCRETARVAEMGTPGPAKATIEQCRSTFVVTQVVPLQP